MCYAKGLVFLVGSAPKTVTVLTIDLRDQPEKVNVDLSY